MHSSKISTIKREIKFSLKLLHFFSILVISVFTVIQGSLSTICNLSGRNSNGASSISFVDNVLIMDASFYGVYIRAGDNITTGSNHCDLEITGNVKGVSLPKFPEVRRSGGSSYSIHKELKSGGSLDMICSPSVKNSGSYYYNLEKGEGNGYSDGSLNCSMSCIISKPTHTCFLTETEFRVYYYIFFFAMLMVLAIYALSIFTSFKNHLFKRKIKQGLELLGLNTSGFIEFCNPITKGFDSYLENEEFYVMGLYGEEINCPKMNHYFSNSFDVSFISEEWESVNKVEFTYSDEGRKKTEVLRISEEQSENLRMYLYLLNKDPKNYVVELTREKGKTHHPSLRRFIESIRAGQKVYRKYLPFKTIATDFLSENGLSQEQGEQISILLEFHNYFDQKRAEVREFLLCFAIHNVLFFKGGNLNSFSNFLKGRTFYNNRPLGCKNTEWKIYTSDTKKIFLELREKFRMEKTKCNYCSNDFKITKNALKTIEISGTPDFELKYREVHEKISKRNFKKEEVKDCIEQGLIGSRKIICDRIKEIEEKNKVVLSEAMSKLEDMESINMRLMEEANLIKRSFNLIKSNDSEYERAIEMFNPNHKSELLRRKRSSGKNNSLKEKVNSEIEDITYKNFFKQRIKQSLVYSEKLVLNEQINSYLGEVKFIYGDNRRHLHYKSLLNKKQEGVSVCDPPLLSHVLNKFVGGNKKTKFRGRRGNYPISRVDCPWSRNKNLYKVGRVDSFCNFVKGKIVSVSSGKKKSGVKDCTNYSPTIVGTILKRMSLGKEVTNLKNVRKRKKGGNMNSNDLYSDGYLTQRIQILEGDAMYESKVVESILRNVVKANNEFILSMN
jgi:hypothetical protein